MPSGTLGQRDTSMAVIYGGVCEICINKANPPLRLLLLLSSLSALINVLNETFKCLISKQREFFPPFFLPIFKEGGKKKKQKNVIMWEMLILMEKLHCADSHRVENPQSETSGLAPAPEPS